MNRNVNLVAAVEHALRAPSVHNTQPWRWRIGRDAVELHADWHRHLVATDPARRDLVISCGAALHHLLVALAAQEAAVRVDRMPNPERPGHLATVTVTPGDDLPADPALLRSIPRRRTDRRRMSSRPVPANYLREMIEHSERAGAQLVPITTGPMRDRLAEVIAADAHRQEYSAAYATELELWTRRYPAERDGIPRVNIAPVPGGPQTAPLRRFPHAKLPQPPRIPNTNGGEDAAELLMVMTGGDELVDRLRAGEATSAALLAATLHGLATTPLSQGIEIDATRLAIQRDVLAVSGFPQLIIRVGWPASTASELPATPRRDLRAVLLAS